MKGQNIFIALGCVALAALSFTAQAQDQTTHFVASDGTHVTLTWGQPSPQHYGPPPAFAKLDVNHDGYLTTAEARAYPPLLNDFEFASHGAKRISKAEFERWTKQLQG